MNFLADESCAAPVIRALREAGHDVLAIAELAASASDKALEGKAVLLFDDLFQSGATMNVAARTLKGQGRVKSVYALALTRTRN